MTTHRKPHSVLDFLVKNFSEMSLLAFGPKKSPLAGSSVQDRRFSNIFSLYCFPGVSRPISAEPRENISRGCQIVPVENKCTNHFEGLQVDMV